MKKTALHGSILEKRVCIYYSFSSSYGNPNVSATAL